MPKVFRGGRGWCWALEEGGLTLFDPLDGLVPFVGVEATLHQIKQAIGVRENAESCDEDFFFIIITRNTRISSALPSSGKAPSSGQNPASRPFLFSKSSQ